MKRTALAAALCLILTLAMPLSEAKASGISASLFIPGLRQLQSGKTVKGLVIMAAELSLLSFSAYSYYEASLNYDSYKALDHETYGADFDRYYGEYERYFANTQKFAAGAGAVYLVNIIDGLFFCDARPAETGALSPGARRTLICLEIRY